MAASEERLDEEVKLRMLPYPDLFAFDAKYHRNCCSLYISERNVKAAGKEARSESDFSVYDTALKTLTTELSNSIFSSRKTVMLLTDLNVRFIQILENLGVSEPNYASWKLKQKLKAYYGDKLSFIERPGLTGFVCSRSVTVGDALKKASERQNEIEENGKPLLEDDCVNRVEDNKKLVFHRAAGILRECMTSIKGMSDEYVGSDGVKM